jgi:phospholipase/carboxylesterase
MLGMIRVPLVFGVMWVVVCAVHASQVDQGAPAARHELPGRYALELDTGRDGALYVPAGYKPGVATPLLVWLHGAGGGGNVSPALAAMADEFTVIVLAPNAREWTWDAILGEWGPDVEFLQRAMRQTLDRYSIDRARIWLGGFSDGGSYSLSLGISYGDTFRKVFAGAPGVMQPVDVRGKPPIFLAHGRQDETMPIDATSRKFLSRLKALGYDWRHCSITAMHRPSPIRQLPMTSPCFRCRAARPARRSR